MANLLRVQSEMVASCSGQSLGLGWSNVRTTLQVESNDPECCSCLLAFMCMCFRSSRGAQERGDVVPLTYGGYQITKGILGASADLLSLLRSLGHMRTGKAGVGIIWPDCLWRLELHGVLTRVTCYPCGCSAFFGGNYICL